MNTQNFTYKNKLIQFLFSEKADFTFDDNTHCYDRVYRMLDISGDLTSTAKEFNADGYGFGTVVKMSATKIEQLDKNIKQMVENCVGGNIINTNLQVTAQNESVEEFTAGVDMVVLVKVVEDDAYVIIFDSMPNYLNYYFLFANIHDFKNYDMSVNEVESIKDKKNNFYFYYGDENTDSGFSEWLEEVSLSTYKKFLKLEIISE